MVLLFSVQLSLMRELRQSILEGKFPLFVQDFIQKMFPDGQYEQWIVDALQSVNISLSPSHSSS